MLHRLSSVFLVDKLRFSHVVKPSHFSSPTFFSLTMSTDATIAATLPQQNGRPMERKHISSGPLSVAKFLVGLFTDFERRRDPPSSTKTQHARLITIRGSHYCEKGRWVMDLVEADETSPIYYTEDPHPPGFHAFASVEASKDKGSITPCVVLDDPMATSSMKGEQNEFIADSTVMLRRFLPHLYPTEIKEDVIAMEDLLGEELGPTLRVVAYHYMLAEPKYQASVIELMTGDDATSIEKFLFAKMFSVGIAPAMRKSMKINEDSAAASKTALQEVFSMVSKRLQENGGEYLMDSTAADKTSYGFTAADLTFAALASPLIRPPERAPFNWTDDEMAPALLAFQKELSETIAGKFALRIYAKHRPTDQGRIASIKCVDRNARPFPFR